MEFITECPVCSGIAFTNYLSCIDHTVSHETFSLVKCNNCELLITSPRPDPEHLGRYYVSTNYISHATKAQSIIDNIYRVSRQFNLTWKLNLVNQHTLAKPTSLLDFGCGTGNFLQRAHQSGLEVCGVEPSDLARQHANDLVGAPIYKSLDEVEKNFDVITLWHVLEHLPDLNQKLDQLKSRLTKNGTMFIAVPNHRSADALKYKEVWAGFDVPRHLWHFSQSSMQQLFRRHELKLEHVIPMKLDAYYVSLLSNKYLAKRNTIAGMFKALTDGLRSNLAAKKNNEYSSLIYVARK